jgi:hypothetical protein
MRASRGMGAISPKKIPKTSKSAVLKKGGKVKRYDGTQGSQVTLDDPVENTLTEEGLMQQSSIGSKKGGKVKLKRKK